MLLGAKSDWLDWSWLADNGDLVRAALGEHLILTVSAVLAGLAVALPLSLVARRWRWSYPVITSVAGVFYTIPSLAAYALLIPYTGLASRTTAVIPLATYTLLILVRNVVTGLAEVPAPVREAAEAMGYPGWRRLLQIEVPLALPAIVAGIRLATVSTIGLATVASLVGSKNLGWLMLFPGFQQGRRTPILAGAVLAVALAVAADVLFLGLERLLSPWRQAQRRAERGGGATRPGAGATLAASPGDAGLDRDRAVGAGATEVAR